MIQENKQIAQAKVDHEKATETLQLTKKLNQAEDGKRVTEIVSGLSPTNQHELNIHLLAEVEKKEEERKNAELATK